MGWEMHSTQMTIHVTMLVDLPLEFSRWLLSVAIMWCPCYARARTIGGFCLLQGKTNTRLSEARERGLPCIFFFILSYLFFSERIKQLQSWFISKIGYPFPLIFFPDLRNQFSDRRIHVQVGLPLVADKNLAPDAAAEVLQRDFIKSLQTLSNNGVDKMIIFKE